METEGERFWDCARGMLLSIAGGMVGGVIVLHVMGETSTTHLIAALISGILVLLMVFYMGEKILKYERGTT